MTSAYLALQLFLGEFESVVVPFDQIFDDGQIGAGGRRSDHSRRPAHLCDGRFQTSCSISAQWWKAKTSLPLPLGGNVLRKDLPPEVRRDLSQIIRESIDYGLAHRDAAVRHSLPYAREMDAELARQIHRHVRERLYARLR